MNYLTYDEYKNYGGSLEEIAFNRLEFKAEKLVDNETFGRLKNESVISETVKRLIFELIGLLNNTDYASEDYTPQQTSEGNDGYSMSFASGTVMTIDMADARVKRLIAEYLAEERDSKGTPLLCCWY